MNRCLVPLFAAGLAACAGPQVQPRADTTQAANLYPEAAIMGDGYRLPLAMYGPTERPRAILLALHGFNDYRNAFAGPSGYFATRGILTVAYDQRGFGATAHRGIWAGERLQEDAREIAGLLCRRYPDTPLYLLGESMGGAVSLLTLREHDGDCVRGLILVAPAVWGWRTMPFWQAILLRVAAWLLPAHEVTGEGLDVHPSDNIEMLRALARDPLVIKATRIDTIYGLTELMEQAYRSGAGVTQPVLLLYGAHDDIIPRHAVCSMISTLPDGSDAYWQVMLYPDGYHMLTRDLQANVVLADILAWVTGGPHPRLPSGHDVSHGSRRLQEFCAGS